MMFVARALILFITPCLLPLSAQADTYWLTIKQAKIKNPKTYMQTCSSDTDPCSFMMPLHFEKAEDKNIGIVIRLRPGYTDLQFFWDQMQLGTSNGRENFYAIPIGPSGAKPTARDIRLYAPLPPQQTPDKTKPVLKFSDTPIADVKVTVTKTE